MQQVRGVLQSRAPVRRPASNHITPPDAAGERIKDPWHFMRVSVYRSRAKQKNTGATFRIVISRVLSACRRSAALNAQDVLTSLNTVK